MKNLVHYAAFGAKLGGAIFTGMLALIADIVIFVADLMFTDRRGFWKFNLFRSVLDMIQSDIDSDSKLGIIMGIGFVGTAVGGLIGGLVGFFMDIPAFVMGIPASLVTMPKHLKSGMYKLQGSYYRWQLRRRLNKETKRARKQQRGAAMLTDEEMQNLLGEEYVPPLVSHAAGQGGGSGNGYSLDDMPLFSVEPGSGAGLPRQDSF